MEIAEREDAGLVTGATWLHRGVRGILLEAGLIRYAPRLNINPPWGHGETYDGHEVRLTEQGREWAVLASRRKLSGEGWAWTPTLFKEGGNNNGSPAR